jgi:hypothetical protein
VTDLSWYPDLLSRTVDTPRIKDVAFTPMPVRLRNELISRAYGDIAQEMAGLLGTGDATWATFGQWASHTVGGFLTIDVPVIGALIARAFADGNRDVFADIGRAHTVFLATVGEAARDGGDLDVAFAQCEEDLRKRLFRPPGDPGGGTEDEFWASLSDPRSRPGGPRHNELLVLGFRAYRNALDATDGEARSRHILLGNSLLALHEQRLLSLAIAIGFRSWLRTLTTPWLTLQTRYSWRHRDPGDARLWLEHQWIRFVTRHFAGVALPTGTVKTGRPVPAGDRPVTVQRLPVQDAGSPHRRPAALSDDELVGKLFTKFDVTGRRARCWADLDDRMAYIIALFAEHQRSSWWWDDAGDVARTDVWPELDTALADQLTIMAMPEPGAFGAADEPSPLSDAELDELRSRPTHLALDAADDLALETAADDEHAVRARQLSEDVAQRRDAIARPGELLDPETCRLARQAFSKWSTVWFMGLVFRSLPDSYAAAAGVHVLGRVSDLATHPFRRAGETAFFVIDQLGSDEGWDNGLMEAGGAALRSVRGVRVMHALSAHRLLAHRWDSAAHGVPFNQEDVLGAALSFGVSPIEMLDDLGISVGNEVKDAMTRFWLGIGHLLGVPAEILMVPGRSGPRPLNYTEARALARAIRRRHHERSLDGVRLCEALQEGVADGFPRWFDWLAPGLMRALGDREVTTQLLVGTGRGHRPAALAATVFGGLLGFRPARPVARVLVHAIGRRWIGPFLAQGRTRPYRRPLREDDLSRAEAEERLPDYWPAGCSTRRARPG